MTAAAAPPYNPRPMNKESSQDPTPALLNAARHCYIQLGIDKTGMAEVAKTAGVARSTLYRYFPGKDELLVAVISNEVSATNVAMQKKLARYTRPEDIIVEGIILALKEIPKRPLLKAVFAADDAGRSRRAVWRSKRITLLGAEIMSGALRPALEQHLLQTDVAAEVLVEWVHRILLSFLTLPSNCIEGDKQMRATLHALLIPVILKR